MWCVGMRKLHYSRPQGSVGQTFPLNGVVSSPKTHHTWSKMI